MTIADFIVKLVAPKLDFDQESFEHLATEVNKTIEEKKDTNGFFKFITNPVFILVLALLFPIISNLFNKVLDRFIDDADGDGELTAKDLLYMAAERARVEEQKIRAAL